MTENNNDHRIRRSTPQQRQRRACARPGSAFIGKMAAPERFHHLFAGVGRLCCEQSGAVFQSDFLQLILILGPCNDFLTTSLVFVIVSGELDLAFPSVVGAAGGVFMYLVVLDIDVVLAFMLTMFFGAMIGLCIGSIVVYGKISSLVATLGLNFFILGIVNLLAQGRTISAPDAMNSFGYELFVGSGSSSAPIYRCPAISYGRLSGWASATSCSTDTASVSGCRWSVTTPTALGRWASMSSASESVSSSFPG